MAQGGLHRARGNASMYAIPLIVIMYILIRTHPLVAPTYTLNKVTTEIVNPMGARTALPYVAWERGTPRDQTNSARIASVTAV